ncbi:MAG: glycosyltransferase [Alphaproteobacteria bacterium]|nr:glycosyltransferase [Alphaproteobacteria bacterium]
MDAPRVTFLLTCFGQEDYIEAAVRSALAQDYSPLRIVISDDCSPDATFERAQSAVEGYAGPHEVVLHQNPKNLRLGVVVEALKLVDTDYIVLGQGDDVFLPNRVARCMAVFDETGAAALSSNAFIIDESGARHGTHHPTDAQPDTTIDSFVFNGAIRSCFGAGLAWHRSVFDEFGPIAKGSRNIDIVIPFRACLLSGCQYISEPLLEWRHHAGNRTLHLQQARAESKEEKMLIEERNLCNQVANTNAMIQDLQSFNPAPHQDRAAILPRRTELLQSMLRRQIVLTQQWVELRADLEKRGVGVI